MQLKGKKDLCSGTSHTAHNQWVYASQTYKRNHLKWCIITGGIGHFKRKQLTASSLTFFTRLFTPNMDSASYGDGEYTEDLMPIISDSIWTKIYSKVTFRVALILKKNYLWHLLLFFFFHQKAWAAVITNGNAYWPKTERQNQSYGIQYKPPQSDLEKNKNKNKEILFWLQILLKMLNNIPPQEVCFYIIQCQITGNFISRAPSMCRISRSHILCRKHFSLFFPFRYTE